MRMLPALKRMAVPLAIVLILGIAVWQYRTARASSLPLSTTLSEGDVRITLQTETASSAPMVERLFDLYVTDSSGVSIEAADIQMKTWMPKMFCGVFPAEAKPVRTGHYGLKAIPVMRGRWVAEAQVRIGSHTYTIRHEYDVK